MAAKPTPQRYATAGFEFILVFLVLLGGGYLLDKLLAQVWIRTSPAFTIWGGVLGFGFALYRLIRQGREAGEAFGDEEDPSA